MKTTRFALLALLAAGLFTAACDDFLSELLKFNTQWYALPFTVDPSDDVGDLEFATETYTINLDSLLDAYNLTRDNIRSIKISDAKIYILSNGYTFDPLTRAELLIETGSIPEKLIAWQDTIPRGVTMIELKLTDEDLQNYLLENQFILKARGHLATKVDQVVNLKANIRYVIRGDFSE